MVVGPLDQAEARGIHVSRFGVIPKSHQPGKWRLIVDLLHPVGMSVKDGIEPESCLLRYTSVEEAVRRIAAAGRGAILAKFDVENAHRIVLVHPADRGLLGMQWKGDIYVDTTFPFGLRSAPIFFYCCNGA